MIRNYKSVFHFAIFLLGLFVFFNACRPVQIGPNDDDPLVVSEDTTQMISIIDSMVGPHYGTCYHVYRHLVGSNLVYEYDTTYNVLYTIEKKGPTRIAIEGCGVSDWMWGTIYFPTPPEVPQDTTVSFSFYVGSYSTTLEISYQDRFIRSVYNKGSSGAYFESWKGEFEF